MFVYLIRSWSSRALRPKISYPFVVETPESDIEVRNQKPSEATTQSPPKGRAVKSSQEAQKAGKSPAPVSMNSEMEKGFNLGYGLARSPRGIVLEIFREVSSNTLNNGAMRSAISLPEFDEKQLKAIYPTVWYDQSEKLSHPSIALLAGDELSLLSGSTDFLTFLDDDVMRIISAQPISLFSDIEQHYVAVYYLTNHSRKLKVCVNTIKIELLLPDQIRPDEVLAIHYSANIKKSGVSRYTLIVRDRGFYEIDNQPFKLDIGRIVRLVNANEAVKVVFEYDSRSRSREITGSIDREGRAHLVGVSHDEAGREVILGYVHELERAGELLRELYLDRRYILDRRVDLWGAVSVIAERNLMIGTIALVSGKVWILIVGEEPLLLTTDAAETEMLPPDALLITMKNNFQYILTYTKIRWFLDEKVPVGLEWLVGPYSRGKYPILGNLA